jgi:hypothetical protein
MPPEMPTCLPGGSKNTAHWSPEAQVAFTSPTARILEWRAQECVTRETACCSKMSGMTRVLTRRMA